MSSADRSGFRLEGNDLYFSALRAQVVERCRRTLNHDLNNAIQSVHSGLELLTKCLEPPGNARITPRQCIGLLQQQFTSLQKTVGSLLADLAAPPGAPETIDVREALESALHLLRHERALSQARVTIESESQVFARRVVLRVVLLALLLEAADAGGQIGQVSVEVSASDSAVRLAFHVRGLPSAAPVVAPELEQTLRALLKAENGELELTAAGDARTTSIQLPASTPASANASLAGADATRILIVDRSRDTAESLAMLLQLEGLEAQATDRAALVIPAIEQFRPDVLLFDAELPGSDTRQVVEAVHRNALRPRPLLVEVANTSRKKHELFDALLVRPVELSHVQALLATRRR